MSSSPEFIEFNSPVPAPTTGKMMGEKTSFSQTCNLLSQYLKEKRSFGDLNLGMTCNGDGNGTGNGMPEMFLRQTATTMNLFPMTETPASDVSMRNMVPPPSYRSMDLFPQQAGFAPSTPREVVQKKVDTSVNKSGTQEPQTAQMTIFYGGKVIVFDDFPADKAKDVMHLASEGSSMSHTAYPIVPVQTHSPFAPNMPKPPVETGTSIPPSSSENDIPSFGSAQFQEHIKRAVNAFPMARSASLQRFLAKRKDRIAVKAPYQTSSPRSANSKPVEGMSWLGLAAQSPQ